MLSVTTGARAADVPTALPRRLARAAEASGDSAGCGARSAQRMCMSQHMASVCNLTAAIVQQIGADTGSPHASHIKSNVG